ncbi:hypothetical protein BD410DRAFT_114015 [Rickenella mellea]|uniref:Uncharacterized protein n=1 Tax=Rickenella mellea TaxID=50990 RepID=A0A4Y7QBI8_9AGAM|nr:hypothetical protein BD410DRAFT_114015 [Rickenella mellea]
MQHRSCQFDSPQYELICAILFMLLPRAMPVIPERTSVCNEKQGTLVEPKMTTAEIDGGLTSQELLHNATSCGGAPRRSTWTYLRWYKLRFKNTLMGRQPSTKERRMRENVHVIRVARTMAHRRIDVYKGCSREITNSP